MPPKKNSSLTASVVIVRRRSAGQRVTPPQPQPAPVQASAARVPQVTPPRPVTQPPDALPTLHLHPAEDPSLGAARRAQRRQNALALLEVLQARWPQAFATQPAAVRPLATVMS